MKLDMLKPVMTGASITVPGKVGVDAVQLQFDSDADSVVLRPLNSDGTPDTKYNAVELTKGDGYTRGADGMGHYRGYIGTIPAVAKSHSVTFTKGTGIGAEVVVKTITLAPATTTTVDPVKPVDPVNPTTLTITIPNVPANVTAESVLLSDKTWRKL